MTIIEIIHTEPPAYRYPISTVPGLICKDHHLMFEEYNDKPLAIRLSRGAISPTGSGYVIRIGDLILRDYIELVEWIEKMGYAQL